MSDRFDLPLDDTPDYDSAAEAAMVLAATQLAMEFRNEVIALAITFAAALEAERVQPGAAE